MSISSFFHSLLHALASVFSHQDVIQAAIKDAQIAATAAVSIATATGHADAVPEIKKLNDGLSLVSSTVTAESSSQTLTDHATNLGNLAVALLPDIGVKNAQLQEAVKTAVIRTQGVVTALKTAADAVGSPAVAGAA